MPLGSETPAGPAGGLAGLWRDYHDLSLREPHSLGLVSGSRLLPHLGSLARRQVLGHLGAEGRTPKPRAVGADWRRPPQMAGQGAVSFPRGVKGPEPRGELEVSLPSARPHCPRGVLSSSGASNTARGQGTQKTQPPGLLARRWPCWLSPRRRRPSSHPPLAAASERPPSPLPPSCRAPGTCALLSGPLASSLCWRPRHPPRPAPRAGLSISQTIPSSHTLGGPLNKIRSGQSPA